MNVFLMTLAIALTAFSAAAEAAGVYVENESSYEVKVLIGPRDADLCTNTYEVIGPRKKKIFDYGICRLGEVAINFGNSRNVLCTDENGFQGRYRPSTNSAIWDGRHVPTGWSNWLNITCRNR